MEDVYHRKRLIEVPDWIIHRASRGDSAHCMIADAIKEAWPDVTGVSVDLQTIRVTQREAGKRYVYLTPGVCQRQLLRFDHGVKVEAWSFKMPGRPAQVIPITVRTKGSPNTLDRPSARGDKKIRTKSDVGIATVHGGDPPPLAVLAHSAQGGHRGRKRIFGIRAAAAFDPTV